MRHELHIEADGGEENQACGLVALEATLKMTWFASEAIVAFSVITGDTMMS
jgi:hypothetical protein